MFHAEKPKNTLLSFPVCGQNNGPNPLQGDGQHARQDTQNAQPSRQMPTMTPRHTPMGCNNQNAPPVHIRSFQLRTLERSQHVPHSPYEHRAWPNSPGCFLYERNFR